jgi:hypothetical protein
VGCAVEIAVGVGDQATLGYLAVCTIERYYRGEGIRADGHLEYGAGDAWEIELLIVGHWPNWLSTLDLCYGHIHGRPLWRPP